MNSEVVKNRFNRTAAQSSNNNITTITARTLLTTFILLLLSAGAASAATITVDDGGGADYTSIQAAVDNASAGDTMLDAMVDVLDCESYNMLIVSMCEYNVLRECARYV